MSLRYAIHPSVGIARVGDSPDFYLAPLAIGGLPVECDTDGTMRRNASGDPVLVETFKKNGAIRRQGARFGLYAHDDELGTRREVTLDDGDVESIEWTVHLANKKACWYRFEQRGGDLSYSRENTYEARGIPLRNQADDRRSLIVDPGPRSVRGRGAHDQFNADGAAGYPCRFPRAGATGTPVTSLGELRTDAAGRLVVIGAAGAATGPAFQSTPQTMVESAAVAAAGETTESAAVAAAGETTEIAEVAAAVVELERIVPRGSLGQAQEPPGWFDDLGDGPVVCTVSFKDPAREPIRLRAWCIVGPPKYAPELVSAVTLDDVMLDVAVRRFGVLRMTGDVASDDLANFDRDIAPIIARSAQAAWSTGVPGPTTAAWPAFDPRDASQANQLNRERYARLFRRDPKRFFDEGGVPMLPMHAGSDEISGPRANFDTLTPTQLHMLRLWAAGRFTTEPAPPLRGIDALDHASVGNCVGSPMDPGIEATWTLRDPAIYDAPYCVKHRHPPEYYPANGLSPDANEQDGEGCEPGDLTKRLIAPWHWDFFNCGNEYVTLNDGAFRDVPNPPKYPVPWWPAQRPVAVIVGVNDEDRTTSVGQVVDWTAAVDTAAAMVQYWMHLGFIVNQNRVDGDRYPYFVEVERQQVPAATTIFAAAAMALRTLRLTP
ncbi:MAG TPA: LodA/GoxA family CTQ-dependent oxidase [Candidatus Elarobacter sp.]|nr:LodA/GoxA family CTQ-dependent oxidase [Candidatus Elarobacter sp.]